MEEELNLKRLGYKADQIRDRIAELTQQRQDIRDQANEANDEAVKAARENATNRTAQMVREHNRSIFDSLKQQAGGVFDALLQKSQSVWSAIGNSLKTALLTAIKDVVTSRVAGLLMSMLYGTSVTFAAGGGLAGTRGLRRWRGWRRGRGRGDHLHAWRRRARPDRAGCWRRWRQRRRQRRRRVRSGRLGIPGVGGGTGNMMFGKPATIWQNLKGFAGFGNVTKDSEGGRWVTIGNESVNIDSLGGKMTAAGRSPLAGMVGLGAFMYGLSHKGAKGDAALIGGGALAGFQMGGPWGAVGGAAVGSFIAGVRRGGFAGWAETGFNPVAGLFMLFGGSKLLRGASEKAREKIKDAATASISMTRRSSSRSWISPSRATAGNLDMTIRTQQVRDLIQLYAISTGKQLKGMPGSPHPLDLVESGGSLYQSPGYSNGTPLPGLGGLPVFDSIGAGTMSGGGLGSTVVNLQIDSATVGSVGPPERARRRAGGWRPR